MPIEILSRMTNKVGPLPAWAWAAIPAVGYIAYSYYKASQDVGIGPGDTDGTEPDTTDGYGLNTGGSFLPGYSSAPSGTSNLPYTDPVPETNDGWSRRAINYLISEGLSPTDAVTAISAYVQGFPTSINTVQREGLQKAIAKLGPAPGTTFVPGTSTAPANAGKPYKPTVVVARREGNTSNARLTWQRPQSNGGSPIIGYKATAYRKTKEGKWQAVKSYDLPAGGTSALFTNLQPGIMYSLNVSARNAQGYGNEGWDHITIPRSMSVNV